MCGIFGVYSLTTGTIEKEIFQYLAMLNVFRGKDSTGVIRINRDGPLTTAKRSLMPAPGFICSKVGLELVKEGDPIGFIGHTRAATKGSIKITNAHPFAFPNVIGVHNGTIRWPFRHSDEYETDSEAIYRNINDYGIDDTLVELQDADPAYTLVYIDRRDKTLNFVRNKDRPISFTYLYNKSTIIWSSTREPIEYILERRGSGKMNEGWDTGKKGVDGYFGLNEQHLLSIPLGKSPKEATLRKIEVPARKTYGVIGSHRGGYWDGEYGNYGGASAPWIKGEDGVYRSPEQEARRQAAKAAFGGNDTYDNFRDKYGAEDLSGIPWLNEPVERGKSKEAAANDEAGKTDTKKGKTTKIKAAGGEPLTVAERNFRLSQGCFSCGEVTNPHNAAELERVRWWNREHYACGDCYENVDGDRDWVRSAIDDNFPLSSTLQ